VWTFGQLVLPGIVKDVELAETAAIPAKTTKARMDERSNDFIWGGLLFLSSSNSVVCVLVNAG
jgi:hypothetical protein